MVLRTRRRQAHFNSTSVYVDGRNIIRVNALCSAVLIDTLCMYNYTSGWVDMNQKWGQREGRWEVRAKLPDPHCEAIWPAIWLMNCGSSSLIPASDSAGDASRVGAACGGQEVCWPMAGEIDIMEMVGQQQNGSVLATYHWAHECNVDQ